mmetsp:Transcript_7307/g.16719  ORF Transcript_7307/g.16719 Transcript_7307/m.16719 type:complete len:1111 (+) Transcript_7307:53-3385(+)
MGAGNVKPAHEESPSKAPKRPPEVVSTKANVEEFMTTVNCNESLGWKKAVSKDQMDVFIRAAGPSREVCVRCRFASHATPAEIFAYLCKFENRPQWDVFYKAGSISSDTDPLDRTFRMSVTGLMPYSDRDVIVHNVALTHSEGNHFLVERAVDAAADGTYQMQFGFWIQKLSLASSMVIAAYKFEVERVLPSVLHSMSDTDSPSFLIEKFIPAFNAIEQALQKNVTSGTPTSPFLLKTKSSSLLATQVSHLSAMSQGSGLSDNSHMSSLSSQDAEGARNQERTASVPAKEKIPPPTSTSPTPKSFNWRRGELIGAGAIGKVYLALNLDTGQLMACKQVMLAGITNGGGAMHAEELKSLEQEIEMFKQLRHPNIIEYIGVERSEDVVTIFLEYVSGGSIQSMLKKFGAFTEPMVRAYTRQIVEGLEYLHANSICHRDIKGANILCANDGTVKLADFGASKRIQDMCNNSTGLRSLVGTPYMMAPEVIKQSGHGMKADIWSLGCVVIEMATALPPWSQFKDRMAAMFHIANAKGAPELPSTLSEQLRSLITSCMQVEPKHRPNADLLLSHPFLADAPAAPAARYRPQADTTPHSPLLTQMTGIGRGGQASTLLANSGDGAGTAPQADRTSMFMGRGAGTRAASGGLRVSAAQMGAATSPAHRPPSPTIELDPPSMTLGSTDRRRSRERLSPRLPALPSGAVSPQNRVSPRVSPPPSKEADRLPVIPNRASPRPASPRTASPRGSSSVPSPLGLGFSVPAPSSGSSSSTNRASPRKSPPLVVKFERGSSHKKLDPLPTRHGGPGQASRRPTHLRVNPVESDEERSGSSELDTSDSEESQPKPREQSVMARYSASGATQAPSAGRNLKGPASSASKNGPVSPAGLVAVSSGGAGVTAGGGGGGLVALLEQQRAAAADSGNTVPSLHDLLDYFSADPGVHAEAQVFASSPPSQNSQNNTSAGESRARTNRAKYGDKYDASGRRPYVGGAGGAKYLGGGQRSPGGAYDYLHNLQKTESARTGSNPISPAAGKVFPVASPGGLRVGRSATGGPAGGPALVGVALRDSGGGGGGGGGVLSAKENTVAPATDSSSDEDSTDSDTEDFSDDERIVPRFNV